MVAHYREAVMLTRWALIQVTPLDQKGHRDVECMLNTTAQSII